MTELWAQLGGSHDGEVLVWAIDLKEEPEELSNRSWTVYPQFLSLPTSLVLMGHSIV